MHDAKHLGQLEPKALYDVPALKQRFLMHLGHIHRGLSVLDIAKFLLDEKASLYMKDSYRTKIIGTIDRYSFFLPESAINIRKTSMNFSHMLQTKKSQPLPYAIDKEIPASPHIHNISSTFPKPQTKKCHPHSSRTSPPPRKKVQPRSTTPQISARQSSPPIPPPVLFPTISAL